jgi:hypothetical protein
MNHLTKLTHTHHKINHTSTHMNAGLLIYLGLFGRLCDMHIENKAILPKNYVRWLWFWKIGWFFTCAFKSLLYFFHTKEILSGEYETIDGEVSRVDLSIVKHYFLFRFLSVSWRWIGTEEDLIRLKIVKPISNSPSN